MGLSRKQQKYRRKGRKRAYKRAMDLARDFKANSRALEFFLAKISDPDHFMSLVDSLIVRELMLNGKN